MNPMSEVLSVLEGTLFRAAILGPLAAMLKHWHQALSQELLISPGGPKLGEDVRIVSSNIAQGRRLGFGFEVGRLYGLSD